MIYCENIEEWYNCYTAKDNIDLQFIIDSVANVLFDIYYDELNKFKSDEEDNDLLNSEFLSDENINRIKEIVSYYIHYNKKLTQIKNKDALLSSIISIVYLVLHLNYLEYFQHDIITTHVINKYIIKNLKFNFVNELTYYSNEILIKDTYIYSNIRRQILGFC